MLIRKQSEKIEEKFNTFKLHVFNDVCFYNNAQSIVTSKRNNCVCIANDVTLRYFKMELTIAFFFNFIIFSVQFSFYLK